MSEIIGSPRYTGLTKDKWEIFSPSYQCLKCFFYLWAWVRIQPLGWLWSWSWQKMVRLNQGRPGTVTRDDRKPENWLIWGWCGHVSVTTSLWTHPQMSYRIGHEKGCEYRSWIFFFPYLIFFIYCGILNTQYHMHVCVWLIMVWRQAIMDINIHRVLKSNKIKWKVKLLKS